MFYLALIFSFMTAENLANLLSDPDLLSNYSQQQLQQLVDTYPYSNCLRFLQLKKLKDDNHISFERHLTLASTYASDRSKLYDYVHIKTKTAATSSMQQAVLKKEQEKKNENSVVLVPPPPLFFQKVSDNPPVLTFDIPVDKTEAVEEIEFLTDLDRGLSSMPIEEWLMEFEPPRIETSKSSHSKKSFKLSRVPLFKKDMFDFLEQGEHIDPKTDKKTTDSKKTSKKPSEKNKLAESAETTSKLKSSEQPKEAQTKDVFDVFISDTQDFIKSFSGKDKSSVEEESSWEDDSVEENEAIISETLANLLAIQGQNNKAIKMYEALSLKFPEKSRLFAEKIKQLE